MSVPSKELHLQALFWKVLHGPATFFVETLALLMVFGCNLTWEKTREW
jgi:hypothetical protein